MDGPTSAKSYDEFRQDKFFDVPKMEARTSVSAVELPMLFDKTRVRQLNYFVEPSRVGPLLSGTGLVPCRLFNGKCLVSLIFYNYREVTIGPYNEVTITVLVRPEMLPDPKFYLPNLLKKKGESWNGTGAYVIEMPVTIPEARAAGRELWGFPKFETRTPFELSGNDFEFGVKDPSSDEWIVHVTGSMYPGVSMKGFDLVTFSNFRDKIWKTIIHTDVKYKNGVPKKVNVKTGNSEHGMAHNIRALGLENKRPFVVQASDNFKSRLDHGVAVADHPSPDLPYAPPGGDGTAEGVKL